MSSTLHKYPYTNAPCAALHLQKLYDRLKDYEPTVEYKHRLDQISRAVNSQNVSPSSPSSIGQRGIWQSLLAQKEKRDSVALTRVLTSHEAALNLDSPKGLMLHGEVGTGKSMLIDLFADCLPNRKKARWHFNTFILETFAKLEQLRRDQFKRIPPSAGASAEVDDYSLLWVARDLIKTSPILFLDEFQLPDRAASKIMTNLMTSFFQLGGVLVATSNRMPEELHKAAGVSFAPPPSRMDALSWRLGFGGVKRNGSDALFGGQNEFAGFLELLKTRCEVWEMGGGKDYRRQEVDFRVAPSQNQDSENLWQLDDHQDLQRAPGMRSAGTVTPETASAITTELSKPSAVESTSSEPKTPIRAPKHYLIQPSASASADEMTTYYTTLSTLPVNIPPADSPLWKHSIMYVYGRTVKLPKTYEGACLLTFHQLCGTISFGPADYISLASAYHTLILTDVPILSLLQKNEARRFILLLDALYEARCKLLILNALGGPDEIFFPEEQSRKGKQGEENDDQVYAETFSEAYQDVTAPFRPNISSSNPQFSEADLPEPDYTHVRFENMLAPDSLEDDPPNRIRRLSERGPVDQDDDTRLAGLRQGLHPYHGGSGNGTSGRAGRLDFAKTGAFTGEDEKFAFKRAQSRLWEMCSGKWWAREEEGWHRPVSADIRRWERKATPGDAVPTQQHQAVYMSDTGVVTPASSSPRGGTEATGEGKRTDSAIDEEKDKAFITLQRQHQERVEEAAARRRRRQQQQSSIHETMTRDPGAATSPFRTSTEPPPKFGWQHVWGTMRWGKKAGAWGQGVEGLEDRRKEKNRTEGGIDGGEKEGRKG